MSQKLRLNKIHRLVVVRHGESVWNQSGLFQGWTDVPLSMDGIRQTIEVGRTMKKQNVKFDSAHTSILKRATQTWSILSQTSGNEQVTTKQHWRLNERHQGALSGVNKMEAKKIQGEREAQRYRRSQFTKPPLQVETDPLWPGNDAHIRSKVPLHHIPFSESLDECYERVRPWLKKVVQPEMEGGKNVLMVTHQNVIRVILKNLLHLSDENFMHVEIPTCMPIVIEMSSDFGQLNHWPMFARNNKGDLVINQNRKVTDKLTNMKKQQDVEKNVVEQDFIRKPEQTKQENNSRFYHKPQTNYVDQEQEQQSD